MTRGLVVLPGPLEVVGSKAIIDKFLCEVFSLKKCQSQEATGGLGMCSDKNDNSPRGGAAS